MSSFKLRKRARVCYYEPEEPPLDEFVFCSECQDYVYEYCSIHGPLLVIPDEEVPAETGLPAFVPRAALSIPRVFLHIAYSCIPEAGLGVFSTLTLPVGVRFGPYRGQRVKSAADSGYGWQIYDRNHKPLHIVDARDANNSNWMRYVNCARHHTEQNLVAFQYQGELYYRTLKIVPRFTELLVFYGSEFAAELGVDLRAYNKPCPCRACQAQLANKNEPTKTNKRQVQVQEKKKLQNKDNTVKRPVEKLQEPSSQRQARVQKKKEKQATEIIEKHNPFEKFQEPPTSSQRQDRVENKEKRAKENTEKRRMEKLQEPSPSSQVEPPLNMDIQDVPPDKPAVNTFTSKTDSNATNFKCDQCRKGFDIKSDLEKHIQTHELMKKSKSLMASKKFTCKKCSCTFGTKLVLVEHAKSRHGVKYFDCSECEYTTCYKGNLQNHLRIHSGEKPFKCTQCSSAFAQSSALQTHLRTHTKEKPFKCSHCSAAFACFANFQRHLRAHTKEKPFKCNHCNSAFTRSSVLQQHLKTHSGEKPYECNICAYKTAQSGNLKTHLMRRHSGQKPYGCDICSYRGATTGNLSRHIKNCHKQD